MDRKQLVQRRFGCVASDGASGSPSHLSDRANPDPNRVGFRPHFVKKEFDSFSVQSHRPEVCGAFHVRK